MQDGQLRLGSRRIERGTGVFITPVSAYVYNDTGSDDGNYEQKDQPNSGGWGTSRGEQARRRRARRRRDDAVGCRRWACRMTRRRCTRAATRKGETKCESEYYEDSDHNTGEPLVN